LYISTLHVSLKIGCRSHKIRSGLAVTANAQWGRLRIMAQGFISELFAAFAAFYL
jgi:hypothetical protein